jgi:1-acyl-sn-glycerol-3-phosphate acyltransferase
MRKDFFIHIYRIRAILGAFVFLPGITFFLSLVALFAVLIQAHKSWIDSITQIWARLICWVFRVRVKVENRSRWPPDHSLVLMFNHSSYFDIFVILSVFPQTRFAAKEELFKIPLFGFVMKKVGNIPIARRDPQRAIEAMNSFLPVMENKMTLAFAPEGTRSDGLRILPFKSGPFIFALQAKAKILPLFIRDAHKVWPAGEWFPRVQMEPWEIRLELGEVISTQGLPASAKSSLSARVKEAFETSLLSK